MDLNAIYTMCDNAIRNLIAQYQSNGTISPQEANIVFNEWSRQRNAQISNQVQRHGTNDFNIRANSIANQFMTSIIHTLRSQQSMMQPQMYSNYTNTFNSVNSTPSNGYTGFYGNNAPVQQQPQNTGTFDIMDCANTQPKPVNNQVAQVNPNQQTVQPTAVKFDYIAPTAENTKTYTQMEQR